MKKYFLYITEPEQEFNVFGRELFVEDGMLCCPNPAMAIPCKLGDTFTVTLDVDQYGVEQFDIVEMVAPKNLNSFVAWLCGFSAKRRCPAWRYKYMRKNFSSHAHHPTEKTVLDERMIEGKLYMAMVRYADNNLPCTRLWAGIDVDLLTKEDILSIADMFIRRVNSTWVSYKLKQFGVDIPADELHAARALNHAAPKESDEQ